MQAGTHCSQARAHALAEMGRDKGRERWAAEARSHTDSPSFPKGRGQIKSVVCVLVSKPKERCAKEFIFLLIGNSTSDLQGWCQMDTTWRKGPTAQV